MMLKAVRIGLVLVAIFMFSANSPPANEFYYGGFHVSKDFSKISLLRHTLKFNIVQSFNLDSTNIGAFAYNSLKVIAEQNDYPNSPTKWSQISYYTRWEAEGFPGSGRKFTYTGGEQVCDPLAHSYPCTDSSWNAMKFCNPSEAGTVQTGPDYGQYILIEPYYADFNLRFSGDRTDPDEQVCKIMIFVDGSTTLKESTLVVGDFPDPDSGYKKFQLEYCLDTLVLAYYPFQHTQFRIYWYGVDTLFVDYVETYNENGRILMSGVVDQTILDYVQQSWVDPSVIYRWYMRDEPASIDCYMPYAHIDSLLKENSPHIPGAQFFNIVSNTFEINEYLTRENPVEYMIDIYPFRALYTPSNYPNYQDSCLDFLSNNLYQNKRKAEDFEKDFWVAVQAHLVGDEKKEDPCPEGYDTMSYDGITYWYSYRDPVPEEIRLQTFLALCYGANAVMYYHVPYSVDTLRDPAHIETGLYDENYNTATDKWYEIRDFTGPRVEKLGPIIADSDVEWLGAGSSDTLSSIDGSFMDSLKSMEYSTPYVEVGFFKDNANIDYFMLVNRRCLPEEDQNVTCYIDKQDTLLIIDLYNNDTTVTGYLDIIDDDTINAIPFTTHLEPGEGKLFKLVPR